MSIPILCSKICDCRAFSSEHFVKHKQSQQKIMSKANSLGTKFRKTVSVK